MDIRINSPGSILRVFSASWRLRAMCHSSFAYFACFAVHRSVVRISMSSCQFLVGGSRLPPAWSNRRSSTVPRLSSCEVRRTSGKSNESRGFFSRPSLLPAGQGFSVYATFCCLCCFSVDTRPWWLYHRIRVDGDSTRVTSRCEARGRHRRSQSPIATARARAQRFEHSSFGF